MNNPLFRGRAIVLLLVTVLGSSACLIGSGGEASHKWLATIHQNGKETAGAVIPSASKLEEEIEELSSRCRRTASLDLNSYAPSARVESELERIDLRERRIVFSTRKDTGQVWRQKSLRANDSDRRLRQRILDHVKNAQSE